MNNESVWFVGWRRTAFLSTLLLVSICSQIDRVLPFILAESIKKDLYLNDTQFGLITGIAFAICYSLASLPLGRIADMGRARQVLVWCILVWSMMTGLGGLAISFLTLALSRIGVALGEAGGTPASHALIVRNIPEQFRGRAIGLFSMGIPLGTMLGFAAGGWANDNIGWRNALLGAGAMGVMVLLLVVLFSGNNRSFKQNIRTESFLTSSRKLLSKPPFLWMFIGGTLLSFASMPFYIFTAPFLIRTYSLTTTQVGLSFGLLQGLMGIIGTLLGGRLFDNKVKQSSGNLLSPPALMLSLASITTLMGLFAPLGWMSIALFVPGMFSFAFLLPFAFGASHLVAGEGRQAIATSVAMLGSGLLGATLSPLLVGVISDTSQAAGMSNGLRMGLLMVPLFSLFSAIACFIANRHLNYFLKS